MFPIDDNGYDPTFLDHTIEVEEMVFAYREGPQLLREKRLSWEGPKTTGLLVSSSQVHKLVRQLSRLSMYKNGGSPMYEV